MGILKKFNDILWLRTNKEPPKEYQITMFRAVSWGLPFILLFVTAVLAQSLIETDGLQVMALVVIIVMILMILGLGVYMGYMVYKYERDRGIAQYAHKQAVIQWQIKHDKLSGKDSSG